MAKTADEVLKTAKSYLGVKETYNNNVIFNTWYYGRVVSGPEYPWCIVFIWAVFTLANCGDLLYGGKRIASAPYLMQWFADRGKLDMIPRKGDVAFFNFNGGTLAEHGGIVESYGNGYVTTIDGNTSASNQSNGGQVARRTRPMSQVLGFGHPAYDDVTVQPFAVKVTASDYLNIRTGPGTDNPILTIDRDGTRAECFLLPGCETVIHEERAGWGKLAGVDGWVSLKYTRRI